MNLMQPPSSLTTAIFNGLAARANQILRNLLLLVALPTICASFVSAQSAPDVAVESAKKPAEPPTHSALTAQLFQQLLIAEMQVISNEPGPGFQLILDAARRTANEVLFERAIEIALSEGSGEFAVQAVRAWKLTLPKSRKANQQHLLILGLLDRVTDMGELLRLEITSAPADQRAQTVLSTPSYFGRVKDAAAAQKVIEESLTPWTLKPDTAGPSWAVIASVRANSGKMDSAVEAIQSGFKSDPKSIHVANVAAAMARATARVDPLVIEFLSGSPNAEVHTSFTRALISGQRYAQAQNQALRLTQAHPDASAGWLILSALQQQNGELDNTDASARKYLALVEPSEGRTTTVATEKANLAGQHQAYLTLAQVAEKRKDFVAAQSWLAKIGDSSDLASVTLRRASILAQQGKLNEARELIRSQPVRDKADERSKLMAEVSLLREAKVFDEAYSMLQSVAKQFGIDADLHFELAMVAEKREDLAAMETHLRAVIDAKPTDASAYNALGYAFADRNIRLSEGKALIKQAIKLSPDDAYIKDSLGWVEFRMGRFDIALGILQAAFAEKRDAEIAAHLGEVLWQLGRKDEARITWQQGKLLNRDNESLLQTLKRFGVVLP